MRLLSWRRIKRKGFKFIKVRRIYSRGWMPEPVLKYLKRRYGRQARRAIVLDLLDRARDPVRAMQLMSSFRSNQDEVSV